MHDLIQFTSAFLGLTIPRSGMMTDLLGFLVLTAAYNPIVMYTPHSSILRQERLKRSSCHGTELSVCLLKLLIPRNAIDGIIYCWLKGELEG